MQCPSPARLSILLAAAVLLAACGSSPVDPGPYRAPAPCRQNCPITPQVRVTQIPVDTGVWPPRYFPGQAKDSNAISHR